MSTLPLCYLGMHRKIIPRDPAVWNVAVIESINLMDQSLPFMPFIIYKWKPDHINGSLMSFCTELWLYLQSLRFGCLPQREKYRHKNPKPGDLRCETQMPRQQWVCDYHLCPASEPLNGDSTSKDSRTLQTADSNNAGAFGYTASHCHTLTQEL